MAVDRSISLGHIFTATSIALSIAVPLVIWRSTVENRLPDRNLVILSKLADFQEGSAAETEIESPRHLGSARPSLLPRVEWQAKSSGTQHGLRDLHGNHPKRR